MARAEAADAEDAPDSQVLPKEIARREKLKEKLDADCVRLEAEARERADEERAAYEEKKRAHVARNGQGRPPKEPDDAPPPQAQSNLTDPDSALMGKSKCHEYRPAYNAQAVVDADGSQLVLCAEVSGNAADAPSFQPIIEALCEKVGEPSTVLGDSGYAQEEAVAALEAGDIEVLVAVSRSEGERRYDFRSPRQDAKPPPQIKAAWRKQMRARMQTDEAKARYKRRKCTVEPVFGIIKNVLGFTRFLLRGLDNVKAEWLLLTLAYNCKRLVNLKLA